MWSPDERVEDVRVLAGRGQLGHLRERRARRKNATFAGRSASRRIRYPYHWVPYGTYTRTVYPAAANRRCSSGRTPYSIWNSNSSGVRSNHLARSSPIATSRGSCVASIGYPGPDIRMFMQRTYDLSTSMRDWYATDSGSA